MKPFDIDLARQGHPVCYRDGAEPDEIHICPDWVDTMYPITTKLGELQYQHIETGRCLVDIDLGIDLFLKTEKKAGWINIFEMKPILVIYETEEEARAVCATFPTGSRASTVKIEWEE